MRISFFIKIFLLTISLTNSQKFSNLSNHLDRLKNFQWSSSLQEELVNQLKVVFNEANRRSDDLQNKIDTMTKQLNELKESNTELKNSVFLSQPHVYPQFFGEYYKKKPDFTWTLNETFSTDSPIFNLTGYPFKAQARLLMTTSASNETSITVQLAYKRLNESQPRPLNLALIPAVYYTYEDYETNHVIRATNYNFSHTIQYDDFNYNETIIQKSKHYMNQTYDLDFHVEPPEVTRHGYSYDGTLVWAVYNYTQRMDMERKALVYYQLGPYFYTSPHGYRVQALLRLTGNDWKGPLVVMQFLTGPYDQTLNATFPHKTTVTFLHHNDPTKHMVRTYHSNQTALYRVPICTYQQMTDFLGGTNDLYYHVRIEAR